MEFLQQNILLIAVAIVSGIGLVWPVLRPSGAKTVSPTEATMLINREDAMILDVRETEEYAKGHLLEARNIPAAKLKDRIGELDKFKERPIIVCCATGVRSASACGELKKLGFTRLHNLAGGTEAWKTAGLPLKKGMR
ncbi:MAG: rhodanese-like domain-containing protein [Betaproteobacteria bacterium]